MEEFKTWKFAFEINWSLDKGQILTEGNCGVLNLKTNKQENYFKDFCPSLPSEIIWPLGVFQKLIRVFHSTQFSTHSLIQCCKCMLKHLNQLIVTTLSNVKITSKGKSLITNKSWNFPLFSCLNELFTKSEKFEIFLSTYWFHQFC